MTKKIKKYKVGIDSETYAISMVESPAIESDFVALAKEEEKIEIQLSDDERHMCYGAALIPDKDIYRNNGEQEFYISFTKESIEKMSQDFMKNYRQNEVTLDHNEMANDITITESWLVEDPYKDKANALGINVPQGTWMIGMKVNQIDVWERVKSGELKGFSVESMISLEDFSKQNENNMNIETNEMSFWTKMKEVLNDVFSSTRMSERKEGEEIEPIEMTDLEEQTPAQETPTEPIVEPQNEPKVEEPTVVEEEVKQEPTEPQNEPKVEEPKEDNSELVNLINSLKEEINALKEMNNGLNDKVKELSKEPSAKPINANAGRNGNSGVGVNGSSYQNWRESVRQMIG